MLYGIYGDGAMPTKVLHETLGDLFDKDPNFWVLLEAKESPTKTDQAIVAWLDKNNAVYEAVVKSGTEVDDIYKTASETHKTKGKTGDKFVDLLQTHPELQDDGAQVLALYVDFDGASDEDAGIDAILTALADTDIKTFAMNAEMVEVESEEAEAEPEPEPEPEPARRSRTRSAKDEPAAKGYTRAELEEMSPTELRAVIKSLGLSVVSRQKSVLVDGILDSQGAVEAEPEAEEETPRRRTRAQEDTPVLTGLTVVEGAHNGDQIFVVAHVNGGIRASFVPAAKALALFEV